MQTRSLICTKEVMKSKLLFCLVLSLGFLSASAYSDTTLNSGDLRKLAGCWKGSLTYLDYRSGKPYTMPANLEVKEVKSGRNILCFISYPDEPKANGTDTLSISEDGQLLNEERIISKRNYSTDSLGIISETKGLDGNDNKEALIRHTYTLGRTAYSVKKEVKFKGETQWILRNEYKFLRAKDCR